MNYNELNKILNEINKWYSRRTKVLSIKTRPFNTFEVFTNIINKILNNNGKVLYILCSIINEDMYKKQKEIEESIFKNKTDEQLKKNLVFSPIDNINDKYEKYDLVIFDDISLFSKIGNESIKERVEQLYWNSRKMIIYTAEFIFPIGEKLELMYLRSKNPMVEPRLLMTRIKLEEDIPLALFEYFKWFKENKKKVLIIVPSNDKVNKVYKHYYGILKSFNISVVKYNKNQNFKFLINVFKEHKESVFIITNNVGDYINQINDLNIVMLFADDFYFNYKKIVYICGAVHNDINIVSEVLMVTKELSEDIDVAKSIIRGFNQSLWEKGYLKI